MMFVNRDVELSKLRSMPPGIGLLYGRRRIGKTALAQKAWSDAEYIYAPTLDTSRERFALYLMEAMMEGRDVILDEFQAFDRIPQAIQDVYERLRHKGLRKGRLLLITSIISYASSVSSARSPLFGRFVLRMKLGFLRPHDAERIAKGGYLLVGGTPRYLELYAMHKERAFEMTLYDELPFMLSQELRESERYIALLYKLKRRPRRPKKLKEVVKNPDPYMKRLELLDIVRRVRGVKKSAHYRDIKDPFVRTRLIFKGSKDRLREAIEANYEALFREQRVLERLLGEAVREVGYSENPEIDALAWTESGKLYAIEVKARKLSGDERRKIEEELLRKLGALKLKAEPIVVDFGFRQELVRDRVF